MYKSKVVAASADMRHFWISLKLQFLHSPQIESHGA
jgi:hypothetical protein